MILASLKTFRIISAHSHLIIDHSSKLLGLRKSNLINSMIHLATAMFWTFLHDVRHTMKAITYKVYFTYNKPVHHPMFSEFVIETNIATFY